jgi:hypothetical protein
VPIYRPPRVGDLLTVRTTDPYLDEVQVPIKSIADSDDGRHLILAGTWGDRDLQVVVTRVGATTPTPRMET